MGLRAGSSTTERGAWSRSLRGTSWQGLHRHALMTMIAHPPCSIDVSPKRGGKKESADHRLSQACQPCVDLSSISSCDRHLIDARTSPGPVGEFTHMRLRALGCCRGRVSRMRQPLQPERFTARQKRAQLSRPQPLTQTGVVKTCRKSKPSLEPGKPVIAYHRGLTESHHGQTPLIRS
jgi:hypothetical protein